MVGIGAIFDAFRGGALPPFDGLVDDDEVAVIHGPAETGFLAVSEALVNIRHTLAAALVEQVIDEHTHDALIKQARHMHFAERTHARLITQAHELGLCGQNLERLANWLPNGRIDQKRRDAVLLLQRLAEQMQQTPVPLQVTFKFEETEIWRDAVADMNSKRIAINEPDTLQLAIIDELRLDEANYIKVKQSALLHARFESDKNRVEHSAGSTEQTTQEQSPRKIADDYRRENSLLDRESVDRWLKNNDMQVSEFDDLINHECRFRSALNIPDSTAIVEALIARLRLAGDYSALARRAREKQTVIDAVPVNTLPAIQLLRWYFVQKHGQNIPDSIESYATTLGLCDEMQLIELIRREYVFLSEKSIDMETRSDDSL